MDNITIINNNWNNKSINICNIPTVSISTILCFLDFPTVIHACTTVNKLFNTATKLRSTYNNGDNFTFLSIDCDITSITDTITDTVNQLFSVDKCYNPHLSTINISNRRGFDYIKKILHSQDIINNHNNNKQVHYELFDSILTKYKIEIKDKWNIKDLFKEAINKLLITNLWYIPIILFTNLTGLIIPMDLYSDGLIEVTGKYLGFQLIRFQIDVLLMVNPFNQVLLLETLSKMRKLNTLHLSYQILSGNNSIEYLSESNLKFTINKLGLQVFHGIKMISTDKLDDLLFINRFTKLTQLNLQLSLPTPSRLFDKLLTSLKDQLIILDVSKSMKIYDTDLSNLYELKLLKHLNISSCASLTEQALTYVNKCINLEKLGCAFNNNFICTSITDLYNLTELDVRATYMEGNVIKNGCWDKLTNLQKLNMQDICIDELALNKLSDICGKTIQKLAFGNSGKDIVKFNCFNQFISLQEFAVYGGTDTHSNKYINDDNIIELINNWPNNLTSFEITGYNACTDKILIHLYDNIKNNRIKNLCSLLLRIDGECSISAIQNLLYNNKLVYYNIEIPQKYDSKNLENELREYYYSVVNRDIKLAMCEIYVSMT